MQKIQNWTKPRTGQNQKQTKSRIGIGQIPKWKNPESDKIPKWTNSRVGQNAEQTKSRMKKIHNGQNPESNQL